MKGLKIVLLFSIMTLLSCNLTLGFFKDAFNKFLGDDNSIAKQLADKVIEDQIEKVKTYLNSLKDDAEKRMGGPYITFALDAKQKLSDLETEHINKLAEFEAEKNKKIKESKDLNSFFRDEYVLENLIDDIKKDCKTKTDKENESFELKKNDFYVSLFSDLFIKGIKTPEPETKVEPESLI